MESIFTTFLEFTSDFHNRGFEFGDYVLMGFIFFALVNAVFLSLAQIRHKAHSVPVTAEVIGLREHKDSEGDLSYLPIFRISDGVHKDIEWASLSSSNPAAHKIGELVAAKYNPNNGAIHSAKTAQGNRIAAAGMLFFVILCLWILLRP